MTNQLTTVDFFRQIARQAGQVVNYLTTMGCWDCCTLAAVATTCAIAPWIAAIPYWRVDYTRLFSS